MGTRSGKTQRVKAAELKLKAAQKFDQDKMRNPNNPLKSARSSDQSRANSMNTAVKADVKEQKKAAAVKEADTPLPDINTTEELGPIVDDLKAEIKSEDDAKVEMKRLALERKDEIEALAEELFQEKMATRGRQTVVTVPATNDPDNHRDCCNKVVKAIELINRYKKAIKGGNKKDVTTWLDILDKVNDHAKSFSKATPKIVVPEGRRNWSGFDIVCGSDDRENRIYKNEFIGACMILVEVSAKGQKWIDYTRSILKELQKH